MRLALCLALALPQAKREGAFVEYAPDGSLQQILPYEHGQKQGLEQLWQAGQPLPTTP